MSTTLTRPNIDELLKDTPHDLPARGESVFPVRPVGIFALGLVFTVSGASVYAYLNGGISSPEREAQTATIALGSTTVIGESAAREDVFKNISLSAQSAIVVDTSTGIVLFARNEDAPLPLASLTKVALVEAVAQVLPADSMITIQREIPATATTGALPQGSTWRMRDLSAFTLVGSSNGGAEALAEVADEPIRARYREAPQGKAAVWLMNEVARRFGGERIYFLNSSGLDESTTQAGAYGSARAVAALFSFAASSSPDLFAATSRKKVNITSEEGHAVLASNTDEALDDIPGIIMGKTGYTDLAGGNLAVVCNTDGHRIVAVVLGSSKDGRFSDMRALISAAQKHIAQ